MLDQLFVFSEQFCHTNRRIRYNAEMECDNKNGYVSEVYIDEFTASPEEVSNKILLGVRKHLKVQWKGRTHYI